MNRILHAVRSMARTVGMETAVVIALNAIIPLGSLAWTLWGSFGFWSDVFGSPVMALGAMTVIESIALIGFVFHVADWAPGSWIRWARHCLPFIPSFQLLHSVHAAVASAPFSFETAHALGWTPDAASWAISGVFTMLVALISFVSWESFSDSLRNHQEWKMRRIQRHLARSQQEIEAVMREHEAKRLIERRQAETGLIIATHHLIDEALRLQWGIPAAQARLQADQERLRALLDALRELHRRLPSDSPVIASLLDAQSIMPLLTCDQSATMHDAKPGHGVDRALKGDDRRVGDAQQESAPPVHGQEANGRAPAPEHDGGMTDGLINAPLHVRVACAARMMIDHKMSQYRAASAVGLARTTLQAYLNRANNNPVKLVEDFLSGCTDGERDLYERLVKHVLPSSSVDQTLNGVRVPTA